MLLNKHNLSIYKFIDSTLGIRKFDSIHITPEETVASDGSVLVRVSAPKFSPDDFPEVSGAKASGKFKPFAIDAKQAQAIHKAIPTKEILPILNHAGIDGAQTDKEEFATIATSDLQTSQVFRPWKQTFTPNWEAVIPTLRAGVKFSIDLDPAYLKALMENAAQFTKGTHCPRVTLSFYGDDKALRIDTKNEDTGQDWTGVLMPMRKSQADQAR